MISLVSKNKLKRYLNIVEDDTRYDEIIKDLSVSITPLFEHYLNRELTKASVTEYFKSQNGIGTMCWLRRYPIDDTETITITQSDTYTWEEETDISSESLITHDTGIIRIFGEEYTDNPIGIKIQYTGGYDEVAERWSYLNVPEAISTAAALQTAYIFETYTKGSLGIMTNHGDDIKATKSQNYLNDQETTLIPEVITFLRPFKRRGPLIGTSQ